MELQLIPLEHLVFWLITATIGLAFAVALSGPGESPEISQPPPRDRSQEDPVTGYITR